MKKALLLGGIILFFSGLTLCSCNANGKVRVARPRCEMQENPVGLDAERPNLSWEIVSAERGVAQQAYQILVASSPEKLDRGIGDLWNTGWIKSGESVYVPYGGKKLESRKEYFWKVRVKTNKGRSEWSQVQSWRTALLDPNEWQAQWVGLDESFDGDRLDGDTRLSARYLRKEFANDGEVSNAMLYICGLGLYEAYINGERIGTQVLSPTPTDYGKSVKYNTFDVTSHILRGDNAVGAVLGNGRYFAMRNPGVRHFGFPKLLLQLEIEYQDGSRRTIVSDSGWKVTANGPIRANNEFDGEEYDARLEMSGWNRAGFNDREWRQAQRVDAPGGILNAQSNPNIEIMESVRPVSIREQSRGVYILDMGQNMVGWVAMRVKGSPGQCIKLRFAELVKDDGSLYTDNLRTAHVTDTYTVGNSDTAFWEPSFTYHGFRYVEISGYPGIPTVDDFVGKVVYDRMALTGQFETSDPTINQIYKNAYWGIRGNYRGMPTDCPQRDERMGWLGDRAMGSHGESFIFDNNLLYSKWLHDIEESQREDGAVPDIAPNYWVLYSDDMTWPAAYVVIANMLYDQFGNTGPIRDHYHSMKKWLDYMRGKYLTGNLMPRDTFGDWCMPPESPHLIHSEDPARKTDGTLLGTAFYYKLMGIMSRFANILGMPEDAGGFEKQAAEVKQAYNDTFFNPEKAQYANNTVTANLLSLSYGMVPEGYEERVFANIVDKTVNEFDGHVSTGLIGIQQLMRGFSDWGRHDISYKLATNRTYPSWGYMADHGATTIWELWNGNTADPAMNSVNHVMLLGDLIIWYYEYLAGIQNASGSAGFREIRMKPYPADGLDYVNASYNSVRGVIKSHWQNRDGVFKWDVTVPANTTATLYIPAGPAGLVTEGGVSAGIADGVEFLRTEDGRAVYAVGSGSYSFASE